MNGFFCYESQFQLTPNSWAAIAFLFKPPGTLDRDDLAEAINRLLNHTAFPDLIVIQCMDDEQSELESVFQVKEPVVISQSLQRMSTRTDIAIASYGGHGRLQSAKLVSNRLRSAHESGIATRDCESFLRRRHEEIVQCGLRVLFDAQHVIAEAPTGFTFVKPSGDRARIFLKTEEALIETERVQFLAFCLLTRLADRDEVFRNTVETIYIDSMAISSVAYALRDLYKTYGQKGVVPRIVSFHSHSGLKSEDSLIKVERPILHNTFCIISASASLRLQRDWIAHTKCSTKEVITLLTIEGAKDGKSALYCLPREEVGTLENADQLRDIRIVGERFQPEQLLPKKIILREPYHKIESLTNLAFKTKALDIFRVQVSRKDKPDAPHSIFVDSEKLMQEACFADWVKTIVLQHIPASTQCIVYQHDDASRRLAESILKQASAVGLLGNCRLVNEEDLKQGSPSGIDRERSLLIVAAVVGKGTRLLSISRDLRDMHAGSKLYVIGFQVAETFEQITRLSQNLKFSSTKAKIAVERFGEIAVGTAISSSYKNEEKLLKGLPTCTVLKDRESVVGGSATGQIDRTFLPTVNGVNLELRPDFAYWSGVSYQQSALHAPWVLVMAAAILQRAREEKSLNDNDRLATDAFQHVVLDPENFFRYNDGIIQSSILRSAYSSELDFNCSEELSDSVREFLQKVFEQCTQNQGEAALEFAVALRTGRMRLKDEHLESLKAVVSSNHQMAKIREILVDAPQHPPI